MEALLSGLITLLIVALIIVVVCYIVARLIAQFVPGAAPMVWIVYAIGGLILLIYALRVFAPVMTLGGPRMNATAHYDSDLSMFVDQPHEVDLAHVEFQRWLVLHGYADHGVAGPSSGELAEQAVPEPAALGDSPWI